MADRLGESTEGTPRKSGIGLLGASFLLFCAAAAGIALPAVLPDVLTSFSSIDAAVAPDVNAGEELGMTYVPFGEVTVNLDEGRMNRYLRLKMSLQVQRQDQEQVKQLLTQKSLILKNWLLSHLSDKTLDEIRGKAGQNMLRREIRTSFNTMLFADSQNRIYDILFEEFNVQ